MPLQWIQDVCRYWSEDHDWRVREKALNRFAQFKTLIDGLTHGWPGSIVEFHKVIEPLTNPTAHGAAADAFHVVCPSLPGFAFSSKPTTTGWGIARVAVGVGLPALRKERRDT